MTSLNNYHIRDYRFIFICGLHRSGTSILFRSLRDHPDISGFKETESPEDEGMHLQTVYPPSGYFGGAGEFGYHSDAHLTETSSLVSNENRKRLFQEWGQYWDLNKKFLVEKSPPNLIRTRFLQAMFPHSYFIVLMRHPLAVTLATQKWYRKFKVSWRRFSRIFEHWIVCHEIFEEDKKHLKNVFVVKYEHFVTDPQLCLSDIYSFLSIENYPSEQKILTNVNEKYFAKWMKSLNGTFSGPFSRSIIGRYEKRLEPFGYSLRDLEKTSL